jgi:hypothetical protein
MREFLFEVVGLDPAVAICAVLVRRITRNPFGAD